MGVLLHLLICTALRAHAIVVEALYKINIIIIIIIIICVIGEAVSWPQRLWKKKKEFTNCSVQRLAVERTVSK